MQALELDRLGPSPDGDIARVVQRLSTVDLELSTQSEVLLFDQVERQIDWVRTSLVAGGDPREEHDFAQLAAGLWRFCWVRGYLAEGRMLLSRALSRARGTEGTPRWSRLVAAAGLLTHAHGNLGVARSMYEASIQSFRELGMASDEAIVLCNLGNIAETHHEANTAQHLFKSALGLARRRQDWQGVVCALDGYARVAWRKGDNARCEAYAHECLALARKLEDYARIGNALTWLARVALAREDFPHARRLGEEAFAVAQAARHRAMIAGAHRILGNLARRTGELGAAHAHYRESIQLSWWIGSRIFVPYDLDAFAALAAMEDDPERALTLAGASAAMRGAAGVRLSASERLEIVRELGPARRGLSPAAQNACWVRGELMPHGVAVALAIGGDEFGVDRSRDDDSWHRIAAVPRPAPRPEGGMPARDPGGDSQLDRLTPRQRQVLALVASGDSTHAVADRLDISRHTVRRHVANIMGHLRVRSRREAVARALCGARPGDDRTAGRPALGPGATARLSRRQQDVCRLLVAGASNRDIAERLGISFFTARRHVSNILRALGARTRGEAVARAFELCEA